VEANLEVSILFVFMIALIFVFGVHFVRAVLESSVGN